MDSEDRSYTNYAGSIDPTFELVKASDLIDSTFEELILERFAPFLGLNYVEICAKLGIDPYQSKSKYADVCGLIASNGVSKRLSTADEFVKSGITMKTIRLNANGMPQESMSFKNIDYTEVFENDEWVESDAYELFTTRFMFVVFKPAVGKTITINNNRTGSEVTEQAYVLDRVFFWTMPAEDLDVAHEYWEDIRKNVLENKIELGSFWSISDRRKFHVRPKATTSSQKSPNPHGGECDKYCYWFNADYVKQIIDNAVNV